ncbi:hypothetical protein Trydic_g19946, partial [Trypoxylus dichotomus]
MRAHKICHNNQIISTTTTFSNHINSDRRGLPNDSNRPTHLKQEFHEDRQLLNSAQCAHYTTYVHQKL